MRNLSVEKLKELNKLYNECDGMHIVKKDDLIIITFFDEIDELDAAVFTPEEYYLIRINYFI
jgi:hypothetical protein